jgi:hypothetical protein
MPEPLEIGEAAEENEGNSDSDDSENMFDGEAELESIVAPLVVQSCNTSRASLKNRTSFKQRRRNGNTAGQVQENDDDGGRLSLFLWLGAAIVASLIVYNIKHFGEMEDSAAEELQSSTIHATTATTSSLFVNKTIHPP